MGSHLVDALLSAGHAVRCFDRPHVAPLGIAIWPTLTLNFTKETWLAKPM